MRTWKPRDVITEEKLNDLKNVPPMYKKVNFQILDLEGNPLESPYILPDEYFVMTDILYDDAYEMLEKGTEVWMFIYGMIMHLYLFDGMIVDNEMEWSAWSAEDFLPQYQGYMYCYYSSGSSGSGGGTAE